MLSTSLTDPLNSLQIAFSIMFKSDFGMARFQARSSVTRRLRNLDKEKRALQAM